MQKVAFVSDSIKELVVNKLIAEARTMPHVASFSKFLWKKVTKFFVRTKRIVSFAKFTGELLCLRLFLVRLQGVGNSRTRKATGFESLQVNYLEIIQVTSKCQIEFLAKTCKKGPKQKKRTSPSSFAYSKYQIP